ncbi:MAG: TIGR02680 family protein, partial [Acidimicrobiales bacterium]|nr:TIGR02680 family protein [Acidimicrobiales bacterium]
MSRWTLNRAGIINVYQYGDVTIPFCEGRLLLRGVNGSGKSTAMNMLLPFLLEADVRRIDAAGEQTAVLRSWMLAGREDPQPVGYLWLEVRRGEEHLTFGCGIRANRSTDRVTTWWFITGRRPGIDLSLVVARTPLSIDGLRTELGAAAVYAHDQRSSYRAELQRRLFGTTQLDQHLRLLHIVRNPRVGDRVDQDLPQYLAEALPQLSEPALDDAAQPLEDLDEHRRNVENLRRSAATLAALDSTYHDYAATEVRAAVGAARAAAAEVRRLAATAARLADEIA